MVADQTRKQGLLAAIFTYLEWEILGIFQRKLYFAFDKHGPLGCRIEPVIKQGK